MRLIAALQLALIAPAAIFMAALLVRSLSPLQYEPADAAQRLVMWYSARMWTLWVLLLALPFAVLTTGCAVLRQTSNRRGESLRRSIVVALGYRPALLVAATTLTAAVILAIVILHMLAN